MPKKYCNWTPIVKVIVENVVTCFWDTVYKGKQLPAHSVSIEIYTVIARFSCDSTVLVL